MLTMLLVTEPIVRIFHALNTTKKFYYYTAIKKENRKKHFIPLSRQIQTLPNRSRKKKEKKCPYFFTFNVISFLRG